MAELDREGSKLAILAPGNALAQQWIERYFNKYE
jgi:hypothetical protein